MFKGNLVTVLKTIPQSAIQFAAYDQAKDAMLTSIPRDQGAGLRQVLAQVTIPVNDSPDAPSLS